MSVEQFSTELAHHFLGKTIQSIEFFQIGTNDVTLKPNSRWLFDGGVQIELEDELFCFAWDFENECFTWSNDTDAELFLSDAPYMSIGSEDGNLFNPLCSSRIVKAEVVAQYYQNVDQNKEVIPEKHFFPFQIVLTLENQSLLQMAMVTYEMDEKPSDFTFEFFQGELLITMNDFLLIPQ